MAGKPGESQEAQAEANRPAATSSNAGRNNADVSGGSAAGQEARGGGSPGFGTGGGGSVGGGGGYGGNSPDQSTPGGDKGNDNRDRGGGNTGGGDGGKAARDAADDARAKATQEAINRDRIQAAIAEGRRQSELQRVAAGIASLRGVPLPPQAQEARSVKEKTLADFIADRDSPPVSPVTQTTNPLTATAGRYGTMGSRAPAITGVSAEDRERMIRTVLGESGGESLIGQTGVASVIANRLRAGNYGSTIGAVVNAPKQFSTWNPGDPAGDMANRIDPNSQAYKNAADIVDSVLSGEARDPTGGALNFSNVNTVMTSGQASEETKARVAAESALPSATAIGRHTFTSPTGDRPTQVATSPFVKELNEIFDTIGTGVKTVADATGASSVLDFLTNTTARSELEKQYNRDKQMSKEDMDILMFNRLHPEAGSNKELYGGRDQTPLPTQGTPTAPKTPVVPPVVPTDPVMPTVPNFAPAQKYTGTPTVATQGFDFSRPFAPRPPMDFANLGPAYAPTDLLSAPPQPLPGIPGAAYAIPYQRLG